MGKRSLVKSTTGTAPAADPAGRFMEMALARLRPNPWNTKSTSRYSGLDFEELTASIESKGLIQPIVVRPVDEKDGADHEIVVGERRYRAKIIIAEKNGGPEKATIQTIVRSLTDDEAMDLTIIENLQRKDLDPLEEARQFKNYLDRHGDDAAGDLADRVGVKPSYVRKRVAVLDLPGNALKAWQKGQMNYSHLEQLRRLKDKKQIARYVGLIVERAENAGGWKGPLTARELKNDIDMESPRLKTTIFDKRKSGCGTCHSNSRVQRKFFDSDEDDDIKCLNPKCYKQQVNNHLSSNWEKEFKPKYGTNSHVFDSDVNWNDYERLYRGRVKAACKKCRKWVTIVNQDGSPITERVYLKNKACFEKAYRSKPASVNDDQETKAERRSQNHGVEFRELFYEEVLPERMKEIAPAATKSLHSLLLAFCDARWEHAEFVIEKLDITDRDGNEAGIYHAGEICAAVFALDEDGALEMLQEIAIRSMMEFSSPEKRRATADHIGIDLATEWSITEEYLKKKTIAEILFFGDKLGILEHIMVQLYAMDKYEKCIKTELEDGKKVNKADFTKLKKSELMDIILNSGIDLVGNVPEEILGQ